MVNHNIAREIAFKIVRDGAISFFLGSASLALLHSIKSSNKTFIRNLCLNIAGELQVARGIFRLLRNVCPCDVPSNSMYIRGTPLGVGSLPE